MSEDSLAHIDNPYSRRLARLPDSLTFRLCNHGNDTITKVSFYPYAYDRGHSTPHDLVSNGTRAFWLQSDYILNPGACNDLTWSGATYDLRDSVDAGVVLLEYRNES